MIYTRSGQKLLKTHKSKLQNSVCIDKTIHFYNSSVFNYLSGDSETWVFRTQLTLLPIHLSRRAKMLHYTMNFRYNTLHLHAHTVFSDDILIYTEDKSNHVLLSHTHSTACNALTTSLIAVITIM